MTLTFKISERLFSTAGNVVACQRTCLKPTMVNMIVFLAKNWQRIFC